VKVIGNLTKDAIIRAAVSEGLTVTQVLGSETTFESSGRPYAVDVAYDSNAQKVVIAYRDQSNSAYGTAIVGTVSDTSISFGTAVVFHNDTTPYIRIDYDANAQKVVIVYQDDNDSNKGTGIVGTVSGTSISFGSPAVFATDVAHISIAYDTNAQKNVISYQHGGNSDYGTAIVGTVSGTSISYGSAAVYENSAVLFTETTYDSTAQKVILAWRDSGDSNKGKAAVGTVSGTSISYGSIVTFASSGIDEVRLAYDPNQNKTGFFYKDNGNSYYGTSTVATVSGTSISFGTAQVFESAEIREYAAIYDTLAQRILLTYRDVGNGERGTTLTASISGTSMTFGTAAVFSENPRRIHSTYDSNQQRVVCAYDDEGLNQGRSIVIKTGYSQATGGTIADGKPVIVNANGTVSVVAASSVSEVVGTKAVFESAESNYTSIDYDPVNNKVFIAYVDFGDSSKGKCVVGTISGTSITYGSVTTFHNNSTSFVDTVYDTNAGKFVIVYYDGDNSGYGTSVVATVSGDSVTFGSDVIFNSANCSYMSLIYSIAAQKVVVSYRSTSDVGKSQVGTVSGTSISWGSQYDYNTGATGPHIHSTYDVANDRLVVVYKDEGNSNYGTARVGSISGTAITWGSETVFNAGNYTDNVSSAYDASAEKIIITYRDNANSNYGTAIVGTVSGTAISFGSEAVFLASNSTFSNIVYQPDASYNVIVFRDAGNGNIIRFVTATISGTSLSFGTVTQLNGEQGYYMDQVWDPTAKKIIVVYRASSNSDYGTAVAYTPAHSAPNLTSENFVGFMDGAALDGTNGEILSSCSIAGNQTGLTPGQTYFVTSTGALSTTAGSPSVTAGTAISSKELIVKG